MSGNLYRRVDARVREGADRCCWSVPGRRDWSWAEVGAAAAANAAALHAACGRLQVYALQPDCDARAVTPMLAEGITLVDYGGFVDLVAQRKTTHSWL